MNMFKRQTFHCSRMIDEREKKEGDVTESF